MIMLATASLLFILTPRAFAQSGITVNAATFTNNFPQSMTFSLDAKSSAAIQTATLFVHFSGLSSSGRYSPPFEPATNITPKYVWDLHGGGNGGYVPPGLRGEFWWHLEDAAGNKLDTPKQAFFLDDLNHKWKKLENAKLAIYSYQLDDASAKKVFDAENAAVDFLEKDLGATLTRQFQVWTYASRSDMFRSLPPNQSPGLLGVNYFQYGAVLAVVDPSDVNDGIETTRHELTHAVVHEKVGTGLGSSSFPTWLDEGLATYNMTSDHSLIGGYNVRLKQAIASNTLIPLRTISSGFPPDPESYLLAYGEGWSTVGFIFKHFGKEKFSKLLDVFNQGATYDDSLMQAFGVNLDGFENLWRKDLGLPDKPVAAATKVPGAVPTFAFSTAETPVPAGAATATPQTVAAQETPHLSDQPAPTPPAQSGGGGGICGGLFGGIALVLFGGAQRRRRSVKRAS